MTMFGPKTFVSGCWFSVAALVACGGTASPTQAQEVTLSAVSNLPTQVFDVRDFLGYVKKVNAAGKGIVQIKYRGGPEAIPTNQQGQALRSGIVDMNFGIASFYKGIVPQVDAMVGATIDAVESRKKGDTDYLDQFWRKRINAHLLGWFGSGRGWYIYTTNKPKMNADGSIDFTGVKIRTSPSTRDFIQALGATVALIHASEVYTALERGVVNGNVFPGTGVTDYGWQKFLKWRIEPQFLQNNEVVMINLDKWNKLSQQARDLLQRVAIEYEKESMKSVEQESGMELRRLQAAGMQSIELKGDYRKKYLQTARATFWTKLEKTVPHDVAELKRRFEQ
jgi:TRAP-type transport system periplasmic protein